MNPASQSLIRTLMAALAGVLCSLTAFSASAQSASPDMLVRELVKGGLVVFMRHGDTGPAYADRQQAVIGDCSTQRNLHDKGRAELAAMATAIKALRVPVGKTLSSDFCRSSQSAQILFGVNSYTVTDKLTVPASYPSVNAADTQLSNANLKALLAEKPAAGSNTFLISHGVNVLLATGYHPNIQGESVVFRPDGKGGYVRLGSILPDDWSQVAAKRGTAP